LERLRKSSTVTLLIIHVDVLHKLGRLANFFAPGKNSSRNLIRKQRFSSSAAQREIT